VSGIILYFSFLFFISGYFDGLIFSDAVWFSFLYLSLTCMAGSAALQSWLSHVTLFRVGSSACGSVLVVVLCVHCASHTTQLYVHSIDQVGAVGRGVSS
jgi:hypothetical protein